MQTSSTALIKIINSTGNFITCGALLDSGSEASFISKHCLPTLYLEKNSNKALITCLGSFTALRNVEIQFNFTPHFHTNMRFYTKAFVIKNIRSDIPNAPIPKQIVSNFNDLLLADPLLFE